MKLSRIALKFSIIVSLIIIAIMWIMAELILQQTRQSLVKEMEIRAEFFARGVRESLFPKPDPFQLYFAVQEMVKEKAVIYAIVLDSNGKIISHNDKEKIGETDNSALGNIAQQSMKVIVQPFNLDKEKLYDITVPILVGENTKVGIARIGFSQKSINEALEEKRQKIVAITFLMLGIGVLLTIMVVTLIVRPVNRLAYVAREIGKGNLEQEVKIKSHDELQELAHSFNEMVKGLKERDFIRNTFGKYVTKQVAEAILNGRLQLGGERRRASILISDIRGFTSMSEKLPPEEVVDFLNQYFTKMVDVVIKYEGTLDKFIGDAMLAVFGAPISHLDDARRAVQVALEMREELRKFNQERQEKGKDPIKIGIAVHTGEVVAGNIGSEVRMEYTVIGDTVNLTSRLEKLNKELNTDFLISETTYKEVQDLVEAKELPTVTVRGKEQAVKLYAVIGRKA